MGLDEELETIEDGAETEAEQIDQETELEDVEEFQNDEEFDPSDDETDLEEAYEGFFAEEGPDGEGETSLDGETGAWRPSRRRRRASTCPRRASISSTATRPTRRRSSTRTARSTATMPMR